MAYINWYTNERGQPSTVLHNDAVPSTCLQNRHPRPLRATYSQPIAAHSPVLAKSWSSQSLDANGYSAKDRLPPVATRGNGSFPSCADFAASCAVRMDVPANQLGALSLDDRGTTCIIAAGQRKTGDQVTGCGAKQNVSAW